MIDSLRSSTLTGPGSRLASSESSKIKTDEVGEDFSTVIAGFAAQSIATMRQGEQAAVGGMMGTVPIQDVVDKVLAAEQAMQASLAVRKKVVSAWLEISRITI